MTRTLTLTALLGLAFFVGASQANAQGRRVYPNTVGIQSSRNFYRGTVNPNYILPNGMTLNQYSYNVATLGRAYSYVPPYALGYNPYPPVINYGSVYPSPYAYAGLSAYSYNPYAYNPYAGAYLNPYYP